MFKCDFEKLVKLMNLLKKNLLVYLIATIGISSRNLFINLLNALLFSQIIVSAQNHSNTQLVRSIFIFLILLIIFVIFDSFFLFLQSQNLTIIGNSLREMLIKKILNAPMNQLNKIGKQSELVSRINSDVEITTRVYGNDIINPLAYLISGITSFIIILNINRFLAVLAVFLGLIFFIINIFLGKILRRLIMESSQNKANLLIHFSETFKNMINIKSLGLFKSLKIKFNIKVKEYIKINSRITKVESILSTINVIENTIKYVGTVTLCIFLFYKNLIKLSDIMIIAQIIGLVTSMFTGLGNSIVQLQKSLSSIDRVFEILNLDKESSLGNLEAIDYSSDYFIESQNLIVPYDDSVLAIKNLSGKIKNKQLTFISGASGNGKSTFFKVLLGLYPYKGSLKLCNEELLSYDLKFLRNNIAYVPQNDIIIDGTILENLTLGNENKNILISDIEYILEIVCLNDFIQSLPQKVNSKISIQNIFLSGGQKQCIGIARALLSNKPFILLDEPFASMNLDLGNKILKNIMGNFNDRTILISNHSKVFDDFENIFKI